VIIQQFNLKYLHLYSAPIILANWEAEEGQKWIVPFGGVIGRILIVCNLDMDLQTQMFYDIVRPDLLPEWQMKVQLKLILPKAKINSSKFVFSCFN